ncbi:hypothetical protein N9C83_06150 [Opitutales bacterium]|nr:hypothetical protein [Opitutales bacterium]
MGFNIILKDTFAFIVHRAKYDLTIGISLLGGFRTPLNRLLVILKNAFALFLKPANVVLRAEQTLHLFAVRDYSMG